MPDMDAEILAAIQVQGVALNTLAEASKIQSTSLSGVSKTLTLLLERQSAAVKDVASVMPERNGNLSILACLAFVLTLMGAMGSIGMVMNNQIAGELSDLDLAMHSYVDRERIDAAEDAKVVESLREVETQFDGVREVMAIEFGNLKEQSRDGARWRDEHDLRVRGLNAAQWERIKALERAAYGQSGLISGGEGHGAEQ